MKKPISYILDCDGVILDSNNLKIEVAKEVLLNLSDIFPSEKVPEAIESFKKNFGKSRYWHVRQFKNLIHKPVANFEKLFLESYATTLGKKYHLTPLCDGVLDFLRECKSDKYVVSGSDQAELNSVFKKQKINKFFKKILGSPISKAQNINSIVRSSNAKFIFIGDSFEDMKASKLNNIDFFFYKPYSLVRDELEAEARRMNYHIFEDWKEIYGH
jgi:phosphoglycolate phosphatase-like HAD superfamily hydrolase